MKKSPDAFRTISEVAEWLDVPTHVLRFWESRFSQIKPVKRAGGRRYYRPNDMKLIGGIKTLLHDDGLTIRGAQKLLQCRQSPDLLDALNLSASRVRQFHEHQPLPSWETDALGGRLGQKVTPIKRVGVYVPSGTAPLPSTAIMLGVPATLAGCREIVMATPPAAN